jgi:hypothetical protein
MITLREKLDVEEKGLDSYFERLDPIEKMNFIKRTESEEKPEWPKELRVYSNVSDLCWGQLALYEQLPKEGRVGLIESLKVIIRPADEDVFDNDNQQKEDELSESILNTPFSLVVDLLNEFNKSRESVLFHRFNGVIYHKDDLKRKDDDESEDIVASAEAQFNKNWFWYDTTRLIAKENVLGSTIQEVYTTKAVDVLVDLSYLKQQNKLREAKEAQNRKL